MKKIICIVIALGMLLLAFPSFADTAPEDLFASFSATTLTNSFYTDDKIWRMDNPSGVTYHWDSPIHAYVNYDLTGPIKLQPVNNNKVVMGSPVSFNTYGYGDLYLSRTTYKHIRLKVINDNNGINVECSGSWWGTYQ